MNKYLLLLLLKSVLIFGQKDSYAKFSLKYFPKIEHFDIILKEDNTGKKIDYVHIYCPSKENTSDKINLTIDGEKIEEFKENLNFAKNKYSELKKMAINNNLKEFKKSIKKINPLTHYAIFSTSKSKELDNNVSLYYNFKVKNGKYLLFIENFGLTSSRNNKNKSNGLFLIFTDIKEIDYFINLINQKKMIDYLVND